MKCTNASMGICAFLVSVSHFAAILLTTLPTLQKPFPPYLHSWQYYYRVQHQHCISFFQIAEFCAMPKYILGAHSEREYSRSTFDHIYDTEISSGWPTASRSTISSPYVDNESIPGTSWRGSISPAIAAAQVRTSAKALSTARTISTKPKPRSNPDPVKEEPGSPTFIIEPLRQCPINGSQPSSTPERDAGPSMLERSLLSQSLAPPTEVPLRATQASGKMRALMGVFRLNPFSMHGCTPASPELTWCGEEPGPLPEFPKLHEWQLDGYDSGIPADEPKQEEASPAPILEADLEKLERFSPPSLDRVSGKKRKAVDGGDTMQKRSRTSWSESPSYYTYPSTTQASPATSPSACHLSRSHHSSRASPKQESVSDNEGPPSGRAYTVSTSSSLAGCMGSAEPTLPTRKKSISSSSWSSAPQTTTTAPSVSPPQGIAGMLNQPYYKTTSQPPSDYSLPPTTSPALSPTQWSRRSPNPYSRQASAQPTFRPPSTFYYGYLDSTWERPSSEDSPDSASPKPASSFVLTPAQMYMGQQYPTSTAESSPESTTSSTLSPSSFSPSYTYTSGSQPYPESTQPRATVSRRNSLPVASLMGAGIFSHSSTGTVGYYQ